MKWSNGNRWRSLCCKHENSNVWFHITTWPQATILKPHLTLKLVLGASAKCGKVPLFIWKKRSCETLKWKSIEIFAMLFLQQTGTLPHTNAFKRVYTHMRLYTAALTRTHTDCYTHKRIYTPSYTQTLEPPKSQCYFSFWRATIISCERVAISWRLVSTARGLKREKKKREREREDVKTWG